MLTALRRNEDDMDSDPVKRCLLCGQTVPPNAVKCSSCGKGRFETEKRHAEPRPAGGAARASTSPAPARPDALRRPDPATKVAQPPGGGFLSRLFARFSKRR